MKKPQFTPNNKALEPPENKAIESRPAEAIPAPPPFRCSNYLCRMNGKHTGACIHREQAK